ncbi:MAG: D-alanyl-D-alanine carboxypeptidase family protein [Erysipelotrichaceae bacterium]
MKTKQLIFVTLITIISFVCFGLMVRNFDTLSRYPYDNDTARELIKEYLIKDEIEYIIEYSIEPNYFIRFIAAEDFNIYHSDVYNEIDQLSWDLGPHDIVELVEDSYGQYSIDEISDLLAVYSGITVHDWVSNRSDFDLNATLSTNPYAYDTMLNDQITVFTTNAINLEVIDPSYHLKEDDLLLNAEALTYLEAMCAVISEELEITPCGGLYIDAAYRSYNDEMVIYKQALSNGYTIADYDLPGHSEHQLGLAIDFTVNGEGVEDFNATVQGQWLLDHAYLYGFTQTYSEGTRQYTGKNPRNEHYRFFGVDLATQIKGPILNDEVDEENDLVEEDEFLDEEIEG